VRAHRLGGDGAPPPPLKSLPFLQDLAFVVGDETVSVEGSFIAVVAAATGCFLGGGWGGSAEGRGQNGRMA
jgi:hypothetical protein